MWVSTRHLQFNISKTELECSLQNKSSHSHLYLNKVKLHPTCCIGQTPRRILDFLLPLTFLFYSTRVEELYHQSTSIIRHLHCHCLGPRRFHLSLDLLQYLPNWFPASSHACLLSCVITTASVFLLKGQIVFQTLQRILISAKVKAKVCTLASRCLCDPSWPPPPWSHLLPLSFVHSTPATLAFLLLLEHTRCAFNSGSIPLLCLLPGVCFPQTSITPLFMSQLKHHRISKAFPDLPPLQHSLAPTPQTDTAYIYLFVSCFSSSMHM